MASISNSIHFRGQEAVLKAYGDRDPVAWSLFQGKQFLTKGAEVPELDAFLTALSQSGSQAVYTLRVYDEVTDIKKIKENTPFDGSFNFRIHEVDSFSYDNPGLPYGAAPSRGGVLDRIAGMEQRMNEFMERMEGTDPGADIEQDHSITGFITGVLKDPDKLKRYIAVGRELLGITTPAPAYLGNVQRAANMLDLGATAPAEPGTPPIQSEEKLNRLGAAIDILDAKDPLLLEHLEKLAAMAQTKPSQFTMLLSMLDMH